VVQYEEKILNLYFNCFDKVNVQMGEKTKRTAWVIFLD